MNKIYLIIAILIISACTPAENQSKSKSAEEDNKYSEFAPKNHLRPNFDKSKFESLEGWDFCWAILQPINRAKSPEHEQKLVKRFSSGQKALYFFWNYDFKITNIGFVQFYCNDNRHYLSAIKKGLELVGDTQLLELTEKADQDYLANEVAFNKHKKTGTCQQLMKELPQFQDYDQEFFKIHDQSITLIEKYIRQHPDQFVNLK